MLNAAVVQGKIMLLPGEICPTLRPPPVVALHAVMHEVIGQKSADGIVVDSNDEVEGLSQEKVSHQQYVTERSIPRRLC